MVSTVTIALMAEWKIKLKRDGEPLAVWSEVLGEWKAPTLGSAASSWPGQAGEGLLRTFRGCWRAACRRDIAAVLLMCVRPWTGVWTYQTSVEAVKLSTVACSEEAEAGEQAVNLTENPHLSLTMRPQADFLSLRMA